ncbi:MAG: hypothetical protein FJ242_03400 [Nitrospira sp.]|nr:hypothetical protein [Nitrospira sp.]
MIDMNRDFFDRSLNYQDQDTYNQILSNVEVIFQKHDDELQRVKEIAQMIREGIEEISPFIQQCTEIVCPACKNICCSNKHGYYNQEDLVYIHALGLKPPDFEFGKKESDPCQFFSMTGCALERSVRPSGCNWYFCESLLDYMEMRPDYQEFDDSLGDVATLWMELMKVFAWIMKNMERDSAIP